MDPRMSQFDSPQDDTNTQDNRHSSTPISFQGVATSHPGHSGLDLTIDDSDPLYGHHLLQRMSSVPSLPVIHPELANVTHSGFERDHHTPSSTHHHQLHRRSYSYSNAELQRPSPASQQPHRHHHASPQMLPRLSLPGHHAHFGVLAPIVTQSLHSSDDLTFISPTAGTPLATIPEPADQRPHGQLVNRIVRNPPNLQAWREKLFHVDNTITLTNDEFETYFPHIDNVYSHRSTQKYKRKNFISHYWDCRMKGRPPGTPKSDDPTKKKRKRFARERDLCDVKIKITEHFPDATFSPDGSLNLSQYGFQPTQHHYRDGTIELMAGEKYWTIQRVNGNGGNGKGDGVPGPHKHTLEKSDEIKRSTVQRIIAAQEKEAKKAQKPALSNRPSGNALVTAKKHVKEHGLKVFAASFCPFSQRVWIALEAKGISYQYCETDPFKRPTQLLEANPRGTVPAIREGDWASGESSIILEYLEDHDSRVPLLPTDPRLKANCRLWIEHINGKIVPAFFALMKSTRFAEQAEHSEKLQCEILALVQAADEQGPYFLGSDISLVDIHFAPFVLRMSRILRECRGWHDPLPGTRWQQWAEALEHNPHVEATTSLDELYVETINDVFCNSNVGSTSPKLGPTSAVSR